MARDRTRFCFDFYYLHPHPVHDDIVFHQNKQARDVRLYSSLWKASLSDESLTCRTADDPAVLTGFVVQISFPTDLLHNSQRRRSFLKRGNYVNILNHVWGR